MAEKVTVMRLKVKVDLQCPRCYKKVKKILCKFPQIRDQVYDEKQNLVTITVVCCSPEKIRDKLCCKGGKVIKSIEIVKPPPPKPEPKEKPREKPPGIVVEKPKAPTPQLPERPKGIVVEKPKAPAPTPPQLAAKVPTEPYWHLSVPVGFCCVPCSEGYCGGPCYYGYGWSVPQPPCYDSYGYEYGNGYPCSHCDYFSEKNTGDCTIM